VNVCPATVKVPVRCAPVLAVAVNPTLPFPLPLAPDVIVSHEALLVAVHPQPVEAVTAIDVPAPPDAAMFCDVGLIVYEHASDWVTVNGWPAIVSEPTRCAPGLAATL
jgi:hypothetical protein